MIDESKNFNYIEVTPVVPTYCVDGIEVERVVKCLFDPEKETCSKMILQTSFGFCIIKDDKDLTTSSTPLLQNDTIDDDFVYELFANYDFDEEPTIDELQFWGIDKVYYAPYCNKVLGIKEFLSRVKKHFVDKNRSYFDVSFDDKNCIF